MNIASKKEKDAVVEPKAPVSLSNLETNKLESYGLGEFEFT